MGQRSSWAFLQGMHTDGQEAHENVLNITNYWRKATQKSKEVSPHPGQSPHDNILKLITSANSLLPGTATPTQVPGIIL